MRHGKRACGQPFRVMHHGRHGCSANEALNIPIETQVDATHRQLNVRRHGVWHGIALAVCRRLPGGIKCCNAMPWSERSAPSQS